MIAEGAYHKIDVYDIEASYSFEINEELKKELEMIKEDIKKIRKKGNVQHMYDDLKHVLLYQNETIDKIIDYVRKTKLKTKQDLFDDFTIQGDVNSMILSDITLDLLKFKYVNTKLKELIIYIYDTKKFNEIVKKIVHNKLDEMKKLVDQNGQLTVAKSMLQFLYMQLKNCLEEEVQKYYKDVKNINDDIHNLKRNIMTLVTDSVDEVCSLPTPEYLYEYIEEKKEEENEYGELEHGYKYSNYSNELKKKMMCPEFSKDLNTLFHLYDNVHTGQIDLEKQDTSRLRNYCIRNKMEQAIIREPICDDVDPYCVLESSWKSVHPTGEAYPSLTYHPGEVYSNVEYSNVEYSNVEYPNVMYPTSVPIVEPLKYTNSYSSKNSVPHTYDAKTVGPSHIHINSTTNFMPLSVPVSVPVSVPLSIPNMNLNLKRNGFINDGMNTSPALMPNTIRNRNHVLHNKNQRMQMNTNEYMYSVNIPPVEGICKYSSYPTNIENVINNNTYNGKKKNVSLVNGFQKSLSHNWNYRHGKNDTDLIKKQSILPNGDVARGGLYNHEKRIINEHLKYQTLHSKGVPDKNIQYIYCNKGINEDIRRRVHTIEREPISSFNTHALRNMQSIRNVNDKSLKTEVPIEKREITGRNIHHAEILKKQERDRYRSQIVKKEEDDESEAQRNLVALSNGGKRQIDHFESGFEIISSKEQIKKLEVLLNDKWGSFKLFEKWIKDCSKWQWIDLKLQREHINNAHELEKLRKEKISYFEKCVNNRIKELWCGRIKGLMRLKIHDIEKRLVQNFTTTTINPRASDMLLELERKAMVCEDLYANLLNKEVYYKKLHFLKQYNVAKEKLSNETNSVKKRAEDLYIENAEENGKDTKTKISYVKSLLNAFNSRPSKVAEKSVSCIDKGETVTKEKSHFSKTSALIKNELYFHNNVMKPVSIKSGLLKSASNYESKGRSSYHNSLLVSNGIDEEFDKTNKEYIAEKLHSKHLFNDLYGIKRKSHKTGAKLLEKSRSYNTGNHSNVNDLKKIDIDNSYYKNESNYYKNGSNVGFEAANSSKYDVRTADEKEKLQKEKNEKKEKKKKKSKKNNISSLKKFFLLKKKVKRRKTTKKFKELEEETNSKISTLSKESLPVETYEEIENPHKYKDDYYNNKKKRRVKNL